MLGGKYLDHADQAAINSFLLELTRRVTATIPPVLWHYTSAEGFIGILESKKLRASHITAMNDAYEFRYAAGSLTQAAAHRLTANGTLSLEVKAMLERLHQALKGIHFAKIPPVFVSCFTAEVDHTNHWGEYGDRGKGYALGFRAPDLFKIAAEQQIFVLRCCYDDAEIAAIMCEIVVMAERIFMEVLRKKPDITLPELIEDFLEFYVWNLAFLAPAFKSSTFGYETEWRYTFRLPDQDYSRMTFVSKKSEIRPYIEFDFVQRNPQITGLIPLLEVVVGPARSDIDRDLGLISIKAMLDKFGYSNVSLRLSRSTYRGS